MSSIFNINKLENSSSISAKDICSIKEELKQLRIDNCELKNQLKRVSKQVDDAMKLDYFNSLQAFRDIVFILNSSVALEYITDRMDGKLTRMEVAACINTVGVCPICNGSRGRSGTACQGCMVATKLDRATILIEVIRVAPRILKELLNE